MEAGRPAARLHRRAHRLRHAQIGPVTGRSYVLSTPRGGLPYYDVAVQHGLWFVVLKLLRFPLLMSYPLIFRCLPHRRIVDFVADHVRLRTNTL